MSETTKQRVLFVLDIDHTLKLHNTAKNTPPVPGMPELIRDWTNTHDCTIRYLTNRWGPLEYVCLGTGSFLEKHYPVGAVHQRSWYDVGGWIFRGKGHKSNSMAKVLHDADAFDAVVMLGDDVDYDAEVYVDAITKGLLAGNDKTRVFVGIRNVESGKKEDTERRMGPLFERAQASRGGGGGDNNNNNGNSTTRCFIWSGCDDVKNNIDL
eukprot:PhM_4_TR6549/c0_g1_i1/m.22580